MKTINPSPETVAMLAEMNRHIEWLLEFDTKTLLSTKALIDNVIQKRDQIIDMAATVQLEPGESIEKQNT